MGFLLTDPKDFDERIFHKKRTAMEWLLEVVNVEIEKLAEQRKQRSSASSSEKDLDCETSPQITIPLVVPKAKRSNRERLMIEKALKKPMVEDLEHKKDKFPVFGRKLMQSAIDSLIKTNSLKPIPTREDDHIEWAPRKLKSTFSGEGSVEKSQKTISCKRNRQEDDTDFVPVKCKKQKQIVSFKNPRKKPSIISVPSQDLPEDFKRKIEGLGGTNMSFVIEKNLTITDLSRSGNRMSMPLNQIPSTNFLETEEFNRLENEETMEVQFINPKVGLELIALRRWNMAKSEGKKGSKMYVLKTQWNDVAKKNKLKPNDLVQVWAFRVNGALGLALVLVKRSKRDVDDDQSSDDCRGSQGAEVTKEGTNPNANGANSVTNMSDLSSASPSNEVSTVTNGSNPASASPSKGASTVIN